MPISHSSKQNHCNSCHGIEKGEEKTNTTWLFSYSRGAEDSIIVDNSPHSLETHR